MKIFFLGTHLGCVKEGEAYCFVENSFYQVKQPSACTSVLEVTHQGIIATFHHVQVAMT